MLKSLAMARIASWQGVAGVCFIAAGVFLQWGLGWCLLAVGAFLLLGAAGSR